MTQPTPAAQPLSPQDERMWAMLAHLSVLLNLVSGLLGPIAALVLYFVFRERSRYVAFHALQSFWMQLVLWVGGGLVVAFVWVLATFLSAFLLGLLCLPLACVISLLPLGAVVYGIVGAVETSQGRDFRYYLFASWAERMMA